MSGKICQTINGKLFGFGHTMPPSIKEPYFRCVQVPIIDEERKYLMANKKHGSTTEHNNLKKQFIMEVSHTFPDVICVPYDVGFFRAWSQPDIPVRCGQEGVPDILVMLPNKWLWFDAKTGHADYTPLQRAFKKRVFNVCGEERVFKLKNLDEGIKIISDHYNGEFDG